MLKRTNVRGCLIGQCVGDAVGMPVERHALKACQAYAEQLSAGKVGHIEHELWPFGQYTDDSQLMREMLLSFVACEEFDPQDFADRFLRIHQQNGIVGASRASHKVAARLAAGIPWRAAGTPAPYARNGSAMRAAPIGLVFCDAADRLLQAACDQAKITHLDLRSQAGAVAIAGAVALSVQVNIIYPPQFLEQLSGWVRAVDAGIANHLEQLADWIELPVDAALAAIAPLGDPPESLKGWEGISPWIVPSVMWSLYSFLKSPNDYWQTICTAIAGDGDTDTTAAMAGAISGTFLGIEAVPKSVSHFLTDQGKWGYQPLLALADLAFHLTRVRQVREEEGLASRWAAASERLSAKLKEN